MLNPPKFSGEYGRKHTGCFPGTCHSINERELAFLDDATSDGEGSFDRQE